MILIDAGPLIALVGADDQYHEKCVDCLKTLQEPLVTVWPPFVEAVYSLADLPKAQEALWEMLARGAVQLMSLGLVDIPRIGGLMIKYADRPIPGCGFLHLETAILARGKSPMKSHFA